MPESDAREILFICTGNYYRSRFSEALFNFMATRDDSPWRAFSRGVDIDLAPPGLSPHTHYALEQRGIPLAHTTDERHRLTEPDLQRATRAIALKEAEHRAYIRDQFPAWEERVEYWHFHDLDCATSDEVIPLIERHVTDLYQSLA